MKMECAHENTIETNTSKICMDCGEHIKSMIKFDISTSNIDENNVHNIRQNYEKNIFKDISNLGLSEEIETLSNNIFLKITDEKTKKSKKRVSLIYGCVYNALKIRNKLNTSDSDSVTTGQLLRHFNITEKRAMKGVRFVMLKIPKSDVIKNNNYIPIDLIIEFVSKLNGNKSHIKDICELYTKIHNRSSIINGSRQKSIVAGIIFYYISNNDDSKKIDIKKYRKIIGISELTVKKICDEIMLIV